MALTFVTRDRKTHDFSEDQEILMMVAKGAIPDLFDGKHTEMAVIGYDDGKPFGFVTMINLGDSPVLEHFGIVKKFWTGKGRNQAMSLIGRFLDEVFSRGFPHVLSRANVKAPHYEKVEMFFREWRAFPYHRDGEFEWWILHMETHERMNVQEVK